MRTVYTFVRREASRTFALSLVVVDHYYYELRWDVNPCATVRPGGHGSADPALQTAPITLPVVERKIIYPALYTRIRGMRTLTQLALLKPQIPKICITKRARNCPFLTN